MLEFLLSLISTSCLLVSVMVMILSATSKTFRMRVIRGFLSDFAALSHFSAMGKASGDVKFQKKIQGIVTSNMPRLLGHIASDNPLVPLVIDFFVNQTELGDLLEDERTLPILMNMIQNPNIFQGLQQGLRPQPKDEEKPKVTDGFYIG